MKGKDIITLAILLVLSAPLFSQSSEQNQKAFQATFFYPLASNGLQSDQFSNNFSFNILWGINGGVNGFELGGIANLNKGDVGGFQLAGITNITSGHSNGAIISGISNLNKSSVNGFQLAGIANIVGENSDGLLLSGVANVVKGTAKGAQVSLINTVHKEMDGFQLGLINCAKQMKGFQLGLINVSDSLDGVALGLVSIKKNGYYALELSHDEVIYTNLTFKMGSRKLYNTYTVGYGSYKSEPVFKYGAGLGTMFSFHKRHHLALEGSASQLVYDDKWDKLNLLNKLSMSYQFDVTSGITLMAGPSFNFYLTEQMVDGKFGTLKLPHVIWDHTGTKNKSFMWIGYNAGICIRL